MPVSGLVVTLHEQDALREAATRALAAHPAITVGELQRDGKLPLVTDTDSLREQAIVWEEIQRLPGVLCVDLAYHDFSDVETFEPGDVPRREHREGDSR
jgi:nitrate reductase NapAB chaperone NapD